MEKKKSVRTREGLRKKIMPTGKFLHCRSVRIGSYKVHPPKDHKFVDVALARDSISFSLPAINSHDSGDSEEQIQKTPTKTPKGKNEKRVRFQVAGGGSAAETPQRNSLLPKKPTTPASKAGRLIQVKLSNKDIVKLLAHFEKTLPIMFVRLTPKFAAHLRSLLPMNPAFGHFIDPESKNARLQWLVFLIEKVTDDQRQFIRAMFPGKQKLKEIDIEKANNILIRSTPRSQPLKNSYIINDEDFDSSCASSNNNKSSNVN